MEFSKIFEVLFGATKGVFFYAPVLIIAFLGFWWFRRYFKDIFYSSTVYFFIELYIIMCWWTGWFQGDSFGSRMLVDFYPVLMLTFACAINHLFQKPVVKKITCAFLGFCLVFCIFEMYLYVTKSIPEETGLNSHKELFSYRLIRNSFLSRVKYINGKKYLVQDYAFPCSVIKYPIGHYRVSIYGHNLTLGKYNFENNMFDNIQNAKQIEFTNGKIVYEFDLPETIDWISFINEYSNQNRYIDIDLITLERTPYHLNFSPDIKLIPREIASVDFPEKIHTGEYLIKLNSVSLDKNEYKVFANNKIIKTFNNKSESNTTSFKIKVPNNETDIRVEIISDSYLSQVLSEVEVNETDSYNFIYDRTKGKQIYPNSNPLNWTDEARDR